MLVTAICFAAGAAVALGVPTLLMAPVTLVGTLLIGTMIAIAHLCASLPFATVELAEPLNVLASAASVVGIALIVRLLPQATNKGGQLPHKTVTRGARAHPLACLAVAPGCRRPAHAPYVVTTNVVAESGEGG